MAKALRQLKSRTFLRMASGCCWKARNCSYHLLNSRGSAMRPSSSSREFSCRLPNIFTGLNSMSTWLSTRSASLGGFPGVASGHVNCHGRTPFVKGRAGRRGVRGAGLHRGRPGKRLLVTRHPGRATRRVLAALRALRDTPTVTRYRAMLRRSVTMEPIRGNLSKSLQTHRAPAARHGRGHHEPRPTRRPAVQP